MPWRFRAGDDPRWAAPGFDDTDWRAVEPLLPPGDLGAGGRTAVAWFRRHLTLGPGPGGAPLRVRLEAPGAARLFVDGAPVATWAVPGAGVADGVVTLAPGREHVLAVRYALPGTDRRAEARRRAGFRLSLEALGAAERRAATERRRAAVRAFFLAVPAFLVLLHGALFASYRPARENLFYALSMLCFVGIELCDVLRDRAPGGPWAERAGRASTPFILAAIFFVLLTFLWVRLGRLPRSWIAFAAGGAALAAWSAAVPSPALRAWAWYLYFAAMLVEIVRVERSGRTVRREGIRILLAGLVVLSALIVLQILVDVGVAPPITGVGGVYLFGMLAFAVSMSLFLAGTFGRTRSQLERRLVEVRSLSEQVLAQERAAHEQELRSRLLAAEDARKSREIAAARELQLSMLPAELPQAPGLECAARMTTATEVGGDFYDVRPAAGDGLLVALGDAAGHGLAAGTVVTAVKAVFSVLDADAELPALLAECDHALRVMNLRPLHMCLTLVRVTPRGASVCTAGMPPVLVARAAGGTVEEVGHGGLPLGAGLAGRWRVVDVALAPGDTLLLASDGLAELRAPDGRQVGFEGAAAAFAAAAGAGPEELLDRLARHAAAWRGERPPDDDLTLVAVRVSPG